MVAAVSGLALHRQRRRCSRACSVAERGSAIIELPLIAGLVIVPFGLMLLTMSTWIERQSAASDAAAELGRAAVFDRLDAGSSHDDLLIQIEAGYGLAPDSLRLEELVVGVPGGAVRVVVSVEVPGVDLPLFGSVGTVRWRAEHVERVPDYGRSS